MSDQLRAAWNALAPPAAAGDLSGGPALGHEDQDARIAVDREGHWHLLVPAGAGERPIRMAALQGLDLTLDTLRVGDQPPTDYFDLSSRDPAFHRNFARLAAEVLEELERGTAGRAALSGTLRRWRRFFSVRPGELSAEDVVGLFGELWFLEFWLNLSLPAIEAWHGPNGSRHDFRWAAASVEVKATRTHTDGPASHRITRLDQLADAQTGDLFLFSLRVSVDPLAEHSLARSVRRMRDRLSTSTAALDALDERLGVAGLAPGEEEDYDETLRVVGEELYRVAEGFPRLTPESFGSVFPALPAGVESITYSLNLAACAPWLVETAPGSVAGELRGTLESP